MSFDSEISRYKEKIKNIERAIHLVNAAIADYKEALVEIKKIKNILRCEEIKVNIQQKIDELKDLISKMNQEIDTYNSRIQSLQRQKEEEESAAKGGN